MFEMTSPGGAPLTVQLSFWQWMKAGMAFTIGAGVVTIVSAVLWVIFLSGALLPGLISSLLR